MKTAHLALVLALSLCSGSITQGQVVNPAAPQIVSFNYSFVGGDLIFNVDAVGQDLSYQWYWQGQPIEGATDRTLVFENAGATANAGYYRVLVWNLDGEAWSSEHGMLFTRPVVPGNYYAVFFDEENPKVETTGLLRLNVANSRAYSGAVTVAGRTHRFSGRLLEDQTGEVLSTREGAPSRIAFQFVSVSNSPAITGVIDFEQEGGSVPFHGFKAARYSSSNPAPQAGRYTLALQNTNSMTPGAGPSGASIASMLVNNSGIVSLSGGAADGTAFAFSGVPLSVNGEWPLFIPMYRNRGVMAGRLSITDTGIPGQVVWFKNSFEDRSYPEGFTLALEPVGSRYVTTEIPRDWARPALNAMIPFTQATASLTGGDMFSNDLALWNFVTVFVPEPNRFRAQRTAERLQLNVNANNGIMWGTFVSPVTGRVTPVRAVLLQQQNSALGYFLSRDDAGLYSGGSFALRP